MSRSGTVLFGAEESNLVRRTDQRYKIEGEQCTMVLMHKDEVQSWGTKPGYKDEAKGSNLSGVEIQGNSSTMGWCTGFDTMLRGLQFPLRPIETVREPDD